MTKSYEIRLGEALIDLGTGRVSAADGREIELRHQSRQVLRLLAENAGNTVARKVFFDTVWEGTHVSEDSLAQCIAEIRQAIGDRAKRIVETVPRKGYRLNPVSSGTTGSSFRRSVVAAAAAALLLVVLVFAIVFPPASEAPPRVIAVLPFEDNSTTDLRGALGDSISENILTDLARYPELAVIAQNSSFRFRDKEKDIAEIASTLGAELVLEGSQQLDDRNLRITARLVDARTNSPIWADRIETDVDQLFEVTTQISRRVANAVEGVVAELRASEVSENAADALLLSLKARRVLAAGVTRENLDIAVVANKRAIEQYPDEPWGHIGLAFARRLQLRFGWAENPDMAMREAVFHAETAVQLAPDNYAANYALGRVRMRSGNQLGSIEALKRAVFLNPSAADAMNALAQAFLYVGETEKSFDVLEQSAQIDPLPSVVHIWMTAWASWQAGECDAARASFATLPVTPPNARKLQAVILECLDDADGARAALETFLEVEPEWTLARERTLYDGIWIAEGALDRWLSDLSAAGLPDG